MTMVQQVLQALGIDGDATKRLSTAGRRAQRTAQQTGARWGRLARRRIPDMPRSLSELPSLSDIRSFAGRRRSTPQVMNGIPPAYFWIGAGIVGAAVLAAMMRPRIPGASGGRRVGDVMVKNVVTIDASATIQEAAQRMRESNIGVLPVVDGGRLRGVITDRDLVIRGVARGMDAAHTPIRYIATEDLACARADWDVDAAMQVMSDCQVGRLPVVDDAHRVVGIVTLSSLALRAREDRETLHTAAEVSRRSARSA